MPDVLTLAEIEAQFAAEWVLIADPETNDALEVQRGTVLYHSKDRDEVYRAAVRLRPKRFAMVYPTRAAPLVVAAERRLAAPAELYH
jgi:hypothetical protein